MSAVRTVEAARIRAHMADQLRPHGLDPDDPVILGPMLDSMSQELAALYEAEALLNETEALLNVERAARVLDALFRGSPGEWLLDDRLVTDEAADALLSLHDFLNDVTNARNGPKVSTQTESGAWVPARPMGPQGPLARVEFWLRDHGHRRAASVLGWLDERGLG